MVKRKEKKFKSKSQKQTKGSQKQSQSVSVNVNLGKRGGRSKTTPTPKIPPPFPFNFPPFFNPYNQNPNTFLNPPPPIPQKQYATFPEGETAPLSGILSTVPTILKLQTTEPEPNLAKARAKAPDLPTSAPEADTSPFVTEAEEPEPTFFNEPETTTPIRGGEAAATLEHVLAPAEDISIQNALQYILNLPELPVGLSPEETQRKEEEAREKIAKLGARFKAKKAAALPVEPPSPSGSSISYLTEEPSLLGVPSQSFYNVGGLGLLPPLNLGPRQQILGAEEILGGSPTIEKYIKPKPPKNEPVYEEPAFLFTEGLTGRTAGEYSAPLTASSLVPTVAEAKEEASTQLETKETKKKKSGGKNIELQKASLIGQGFVTGGENTPKPTAEPPKKVRAPYGSKSRKTGFNPTQTALAFPAPIAQANDIPSNITGLLGLSIAEQPLATYIIPEKPTFELASSKPPLASISGGIERRRGAALTPAEEDILLKQSTIPPLFTQRSQTTL